MNRLEKAFSIHGITISLFSITLLIYLASISKDYHFDSISLAIWAEKGIFYVVDQQHHIFLTLINTIFYRFFLQLFHFQSALLSLAILGCLLGALGNAFFFVYLNNLLRDKISAVFGALCLAFSLNYWRYSVLVETHILPTFFLICALYFLSQAVKIKSRRNIFYASVFTSLSLFSSGANIVFVPSFLVFIGFSSFPSAKEKFYYIGIYLKTFLLCWLLPFSLFGLVILLDHIHIKHRLIANLNNIIDFYILWFKGQVQVEGFRLANFLLIKENIAQSIFTFRTLLVDPIILSIAIILFFFRKTKESLILHPNVFFSLLAALALFLSTILFYESFNLQRYTPLLIFIWPAICLLLRKRTILVLIAIFLFINNFILAILPQHKEKNNIVLQEALLLKENTDKHDIVVTRGMLADWPTRQMNYIPYFTGCDIFKLEDEELISNIASVLDAGNRVFITADALNSVDAEKKEALDSIKKHYSIEQYAVKGKVIIYQVTSN